MYTPTDAERAAFKNVWVIAEMLDSKVQSVTHELLGAARRLADTRGSEVFCVVMGNGVDGEAEQLLAYQADTVIVIDDPTLENFVDEIQAKALCRLIDKYKPEIVICGATTRGRALIPRVAVMTRAGLTADCTGLEIEPESGLLLQTRPAFGGNIMATIKCENYRPQMSTVRPRVMTAPEPDASRKGRIIKEDLEDAEKKARMRVLEVMGDSSDAVRLSDAKFIVTGGRGMKGPENFQLLHDFATRVGGAVGASRAAVDAGWIPYAHQVGQTGQTVQAKVYMACGVSGQIQHLVGMQSCDYIIAINKDPDAPMMQLADVAIVGDLFEVIPKLIAELPRT